MTEARMLDLRALLDDVLRTRADEQKARGRASAEIYGASRAHLRALETYALALQGRGWPLPPKMGQELHIQRSLCRGGEGRWR